MIGREKGKVPYVDEDEYDIYCWLYVYEEMWDIEEMELCWNCGQYFIKGGVCEC